MALRVDLGASGSLFLAFNQDASCISIADFHGIRIWNLCTHQLCLDLPLGAISCAHMLFCTSLVAFVGAGEQPHLTPRKLTLLNTHANSVIQSIPFPSSVLGVQLNRKRLVAVLERRAFVYDLESLALLGTLDTPPNPRGLAALVPGGAGGDHPGAPCLLALPAEGGAVRVYDLARPGGAVDVLCELEAHKAPVTVMAWDEEGALLATASKKGTVVRVHAVRRSEERALEFRRGSTPATITCLAFSPPAVQPRLLCAASDHGTIHIFRLHSAGRHPAARAAHSLLSAVMPGVVEPQRPLATVRLPGRSHAAICAVRQDVLEAAPGGPWSGQPGSTGGGTDGGGGGSPLAGAGGGHAGGHAVGAEEERETRLAVATGEGVLYSFRLELPSGGESGSDGSGSGLRHSLEGEWSLMGSGGSAAAAAAR